MANHPNTPPRCHNCQHWIRAKSQKWNVAFQEYEPVSTQYGLCRSFMATKHDTYITLSKPDKEDLYNEDEQLFNLNDPVTDMYTIEYFLCIYHEPSGEPEDSPTPPAAA